MPASPDTKRRSLSGFTLIELMVSVSILALLIAILGGIFGQVSRAWITSEGDIERRRNNRALTDFIGNELRSAVVPVEQSVTTGKSNLQFLINPPTDLVSRERFGNADTAFWQSPVATETSFGELAEVGYFVRWSETGNPRPSLCRLFINPSKPSSASSGAATIPNDQHFLIYKKPRWLSDPLLDELAPAEAPAYKGLFAENVVGFWIRAYGPDGAELLTNGTRSFDSRVGYQFTNATGAVEDRFLPARVRVSLAQLDSRSVHLLDSSAGLVRTLARRGDVRDAAEFLQALQDDARNTPALARLLPGLRIYSTEVQLENAR